MPSALSVSLHPEQEKDDPGSAADSVVTISNDSSVVENKSMPSRLLLGLRVSNSVMGITLDSESESESEEEMYSMLSISMGIVPRIWKGAERRGGNVDASGRSETVQSDDIEASGTFVLLVL